MMNEDVRFLAQFSQLKAGDSVIDWKGYEPTAGP
jgi:hypothetical protein